MTNTWSKKHYKITDKVRIDYKVKAVLNYCIKKNKETAGFRKYFCFTFNQFKSHFNNLFKENMCFDNYGFWQVDHKIPKAYFNYSSIKDIEYKKCWCLNNLQPLEKKLNQKKGKKYK